ncbi:MAG: HAD-IC family P-type ATPase, partial [Methanocorpusculum sp.]|nr:HAD-IC family P-type ATPase [Methanocorpusculum sp.]
MKISLTKNQKTELARIIVSGILLLAAVLIPNETASTIIFLASYIIAGYDVLYHALRNIFRGHVLDENFLMGIATIGALALGEFPEAVAVMLFYKVGELFEDFAVNRSRKSIAELMDISPDYANVERGADILTVSPEDVKIGETILVKAGEKIPLDGVVLEGNSELNTSALTGESLPRAVAKGDSVISGCVNLSGLLKIKVEKEFGESTVSKILELVENASNKKSKAENFITKFARYYTPIVVISAAVLALIP